MSTRVRENDSVPIVIYALLTVVDNGTLSLSRILIFPFHVLVIVLRFEL